jgi:hypothetical protein
MRIRDVLEVMDWRQNRWHANSALFIWRGGLPPSLPPGCCSPLHSLCEGTMLTWVLKKLDCISQLFGKSIGGLLWTVEFCFTYSHTAFMETAFIYDDRRLACEISLKSSSNSGNSVSKSQWALQAACSFIVCWFPLSFTACLGTLHADGDTACNTDWTVQCSRMVEYSIRNIVHSWVKKLVNSNMHREFYRLHLLGEELSVMYGFVKMQNQRSTLTPVTKQLLISRKIAMNHAAAYDFCRRICS